MNQLRNWKISYQIKFHILDLSGVKRRWQKDVKETREKDPTSPAVQFRMQMWRAAAVLRALRRRGPDRGTAATCESCGFYLIGILMLQWSLIQILDFLCHFLSFLPVWLPIYQHERDKTSILKQNITKRRGNKKGQHMIVHLFDLVKFRSFSISLAKFSEHRSILQLEEYFACVVCKCSDEMAEKLWNDIISDGMNLPNHFTGYTCLANSYFPIFLFQLF